VVGSGVMGERLAGGNVALALLANSLATGAGLIGILLAFGPLSGAHLNPIVTLAEAWSGRFPRADVPAYLFAQVAGAFAGVAAAHLMFGKPLFSVATIPRPGWAQVLGEFVATLGLVLVIRGSSGSGSMAAALAVGCYIAAAYWFTSSTAFANPAVTLGRALSDTFAGIRPRDVPGLLMGQVAGGVTAVALGRWLRNQRRIA
jgi:glycerol uptake facilitator-like aquaporin